MKKIIILSLLIISFVLPTKNAHALDPKGKAFVIICTYGTVGGALLGFASMAFGTNSRAIAQGASLGLYAGIAFGAYVISSHKKQIVDPGTGYPEDSVPPPGFDGPAGGFAPVEEGGGGFGAPPPGEDQGGFFGAPERIIEINNDLVFNYKLKNKKGRGFSPPVYINLLQARF